MLLGDPAWLPHPVVGIGRWIGFLEHRLNRGTHRRLKGALLVTLTLALLFLLAWLLPRWTAPLLVFFCLAGRTLRREVAMVFEALDRSLDDGRRQVARIVGRDTGALTAQEVRTAALETLSENLSDGVVAPLFWYALLGVPGMVVYKAVNTFDSMVGYRTERYRAFGCWAARIDDVANYIPARLTALLMLAVGRRWARRPGLSFLFRYGPQHASPNSGYPEAALAGILNCRFGGPHYYFGQIFDKPYIGENDRQLTTADMETAVRVNRVAEVLAIFALFALFHLCAF
jgi:adenosylcobinamide-phosphate synthase